MPAAPRGLSHTIPNALAGRSPPGAEASNSPTPQLPATSSPRLPRPQKAGLLAAAPLPRTTAGAPAAPTATNGRGRGMGGVGGCRAPPAPTCGPPARARVSRRSPPRACAEGAAGGAAAPPGGGGRGDKAAPHRWERGEWTRLPSPPVARLGSPVVVAAVRAAVAAPGSPARPRGKGKKDGGVRLCVCVGVGVGVGGLGSPQRCHFGRGVLPAFLSAPGCVCSALSLLPLPKSRKKPKQTKKALLYLRCFYI